MICLLPHCSYLSETSRMLAIRRALLARGARVTVATHGGTHERLLRQLGVPYDIVGPAMTEERSRRFVHHGPGIGAPSQSMMVGKVSTVSEKSSAGCAARRGQRSSSPN